MVELIYKELSYELVGCAQRVHSALGPGFPEAVYHRAMCKELSSRKIPFQSQAEFEVFYQDNLCGRFKVDIDVHEQVVLELKAAEALTDEHRAQTLAYLKASRRRLAILMNFGRTRLVAERIVN